MNEPRDVFHFVGGYGFHGDRQSLSVTEQDARRGRCTQRTTVRRRRARAEHEVTLLRADQAVLINPDPDRVVKVGDLVIDVAGVSVRMAGVKLGLPWREFQVLMLLADNAGRVLSAESLRSHIWEAGFVDDAGNLKTHVARLRKRMKQHLGADYIRTVRGIGYVLEAP